MNTLTIIEERAMVDNNEMLYRELLRKLRVISPDSSSILELLEESRINPIVVRRIVESLLLLRNGFGPRDCIKIYMRKNEKGKLNCDFIESFSSRDVKEELFY